MEPTTALIAIVASAGFLLVAVYALILWIKLWAIRSILSMVKEVIPGKTPEPVGTGGLFFLFIVVLIAVMALLSLFSL
jgi:hypothetical protein